jgi:uncharacterized protein YegL
MSDSNREKMSEEIDQRNATGFGHKAEDIHGNADRRCPTLLLLDVSASMSGKPLEELQAGLTQYIDEVAADSLAKRRLEIAIVTFGGSVQVVQEFATPDRIVVPTLVATGDTPMGQAIVTGLDLLRDRRVELSSQAVSQYKPWIFLITDGGPTDDGKDIWHEGVRRLKEVRGKRAQFFAVGVEGANMDKLSQLCEDTRSADEPPTPPLTLQGLKFRALFKWLSESQRAVARSSPGDSVARPPVSGWASGQA